MNDTPAVPDALAALTPARVGLGRSGTSLPTAALLQFRADHALARDAVHEPFDAVAFVERGVPGARIAASAVGDRDTYLRRPDLGRRLTEEARAELRALAPVDVAVIATDGLSATAITRHGAAVLTPLVAGLRAVGLSEAVVVVPFARVAVMSGVGSALRARAAVIVIGERPGLSAPDNLSIYVEVDPRVDHTDADRNCLSNIRPQGLPPERAADQAVHLVTAGLREGRSGTALSVEFPDRDGSAGLSSA